MLRISASRGELHWKPRTTLVEHLNANECLNIHNRVAMNAAGLHTDSSGSFQVPCQQTCRSSKKLATRWVVVHWLAGCVKGSASRRRSIDIWLSCTSFIPPLAIRKRDTITHLFCFGYACVGMASMRQQSGNHGGVNLSEQRQNAAKSTCC